MHLKEEYLKNERKRTAKTVLTHMENKTQISSDQTVTLQGTIEHVTYHNDDNGYSVCTMIYEGEEITVVGIMPYINAGETVKITGKWETHSSYGVQLKVITYEKELPANATAMYKYLASGAIKGVGESTAKKIVDMFGDDTFDVIENHPEYLSDIPGISPKKASKIHDEFVEQFGMRSLMVHFKDHFGPATILKIYKRWGSAAVDVISDNPYLLCEEIYGIGFEKADEYASIIGYNKESESRVGAGIKHVLSANAMQNGHVFVPEQKLLPLAAQILESNEEFVRNVYEKGISGIKTVKYKGTSCVYLQDYYDAEQYISVKLSLLDEVCVKDGIDDIGRLVHLVETEEGIEYAAAQKKAIKLALSNGVMVLTGGPGTGKTTIIRAIIRIAERMGYNVALAAPTGRAAKRMSEATQQEAKTIHRMLEMKFAGDEDRPEFMRNEKNLLDEQLVIIDESSMVDTMLMASLLKAIKPGARLILIGDADQLPSVGAGNVLCDIIDSDKFCTVRLTEIFRQAQESRIVTNAHAINNGELPVLDDKKGDFFFISREDEQQIAKTVADLCQNRLPRTYGDKIRDEIQVITPSRKGVAGTQPLNTLLQNVLNPAGKNKAERIYRGLTFREGDKVMQIKNNYDIEWDRNGESGVGIFNGDIGIIKRIDRQLETMIIDFDERIAEYEFKMLDELEHAYAITVHKSQGSEYSVVIIPMYSYTPRLLTRNLLYTAVTRAQKMVILVGKASVVASMVENKRLTSRYTGLKYLLAPYNYQ